MVSVAAQAGGPAAPRLPSAPRIPLILFLAVTPLCHPVGGGMTGPPWAVLPGPRRRVQRWWLPALPEWAGVPVSCAVHAQGGAGLGLQSIGVDLPLTSVCLLGPGQLGSLECD